MHPHQQHSPFQLLLLWPAFIFVVAVPVAAQETNPLEFNHIEQVKSAFQSNVRPLLKKYCFRCHNEEEMESGIQVDHLDGSLMDRQVFLWKEILKNIENGSMPPEDEMQPSDKEKRAIASWGTKAIRFVRLQPQPKNGSSRRLTTAQYRNTLRTLLGITENVGAGLPPDAVSKDGFLNNEKTMLLSPLLLESYFDAAEKALDLCLVDVNEEPTIQNFKVEFGKNINSNPYPKKLILGANSHLLENQDFVVEELIADKNFPFQPFRMQRKFRFIEGYQGNSTVRGWRDFDSIYHAVFACMRGNGGYPKGLAYDTVPGGLLLRPAIPSAELFGVESTYGPRANFKIALRELPDEGRFLVKVRAAKYVGGMLLDRGKSAVTQTSPNTIVVENPSNLVEIDVPNEGIYQANIRLGSAMASRVKPDGSKLNVKLAGAWNFDEDYSELRGTKELTGIPLGKTKTVGSPFGKSLQLDGRDDSIKVMRNKRLDVGTDDFTVSAWIRPTKLRQAGIVCMGKYSWTHGWYLDMPNGKGVIRIETAGPDNAPNGTVQSKPGILKSDQWQHVAAVVRRGTDQTRLYVNGFLVAKGTIEPKNLDNPKVDLYIGRIQDAQHFKGNIDQVRIYQRALEEAEIQALLEGGESYLRPPQAGQPKVCRLTLESTDDKSDTEEISGILHQEEFALMRLGKGKLKLKASYEGNESVAQISLTPIDVNGEWGERFEAFEKRTPSLGVYLGLRRDCGHTLAPVGTPQVVGSRQIKEYRFIGDINNFPNPRVEADNVNYLAGVREIGVRSEYTDGRDMPRLLIKSIEFEGPFFESWPPKSHQSILHPTKSGEDPTAYATTVLRRFADKAFRRAASDEEVEALLKVFRESYRQSGNTQSSIKDAIVVALTSPQFLFLIEKSSSPAAEPVSESELASKLSYFLWNGPPDSRTLELASKKMLSKSLASEVDRMIRDRKFAEFCRAFTQQWLNLDKLKVVNIDRKKFPRLTRDTKMALGREPVEFLRYLVQKNRPVKELITADYVLANEITATYYQLKNDPESGFHFEPVKIDRPELGGLLGQAGVLSGLSDGRESNPIKRGAWLARKIIAEPPEDPPPNVPELGEDTSHLPLRERLSIHRNQKGCVNCHTGIDPWGLPLEQFDASGLFQKTRAKDAESTLPDNTEIKGFMALKKYLAEDRIDQVVFSFVKHLTIYAIGRSLTYNELELLKQRCIKLKVRDYNMRDIFMLVVQSEMFLEK